MANYDTLTANGNSAESTVSGQVLLILGGTDGGGTATVQVKRNDGTWQAMTDASFTAETMKLLEFPDKTKVQARVNLTGATSPSLYVEFRS